MSEIDFIPAGELEILDRVGAEVMETMFFTEAEPADCDHHWFSAALAARVQFRGTHQGDVVMTVSAEAAQSIAAGFLGLDLEEMAPAQLNQVILELANIFCGAAMSHLWPESNLALDPPELIAAAEPLNLGWHRCFAMPEGMLAITIRLCGPDETAPEGNAA